MRRFPMFVVLVVLATRLFVPSSEASYARWSTMEAPTYLGRDETSTGLFPGLIGEMPAGFYGDHVGSSSRFIVNPRLDSTALLLWIDDQDEIRVGAGLGRILRTDVGIAAWAGRDGTEESQTREETPDLSFSSSRQETTDRYGMSLGLHRGEIRGAHLDATVELEWLRSHSEYQSTSTNSEATRYDLTPSGGPAWRLRGMLSAPMQEGWLRAFAEGGIVPRRQRIQEVGGFVRPAFDLPLIGERDRFIAGDLSWLGPVGVIDLMAAGLQIERTWERSGFLRLSNRSHATTELRRFSAKLFVGSEVWLKDWVCLRAGASRTYRNAESDQEELFWSTGGGLSRRNLRAVEADGFSGAVLRTGCGLRFEKLRIDIELNRYQLFSGIYGAVSFSYPF